MLKPLQVPSCSDLPAEGGYNPFHSDDSKMSVKAPKSNITRAIMLSPGKQRVTHPHILAIEMSEVSSLGRGELRAHGENKAETRATQRKSSTLDIIDKGEGGPGDDLRGIMYKRTESESGSTTRSPGRFGWGWVVLHGIV